ncbi:MAG TPA: RIO1 family regulatory kinase/ATPase [Dehalococcoidia bacterium]|nr:RIO1 family regulatory kinase/ATPase [Dehalococcoidia bacterium]
MRRSQGGDHLEQLETFIDQGFVQEVLGLVRIGKEATVYCCRAGSALDVDLVAAKVYRARQYRFKNDAVYQEARVREMGIRGSAKRAFENRKSAVGQGVREGVWRHREFETMQLLHGAGSDVPRPIHASGDVILMDYVGDEEAAAPPLQRVRLDQAAAPALFQRLMNNVELWLALNRVHGDFSPHNILYWQGEPWIIDFPQATDPRFNNHARDLLRRDIDNVCRYFAPYGIEASADVIADDLWRRFMRAEL